MDHTRLRGRGVSPGIAIGEVFLTERVIFTSRKESISPLHIKEEIRRLQKAIKKTKGQLTHIKEQIKSKMGKEHSFIFEAHLMILEDRSLLKNLEKIIKEERAKAEWALSQVHSKYYKVFESIDDEYLKERMSDVSDVLARIYRNLEVRTQKKRDGDKEKILVAHELLPSEAALRLSQGYVLAVAMDMGGQTSHTAILARSLNIPAVVGLHNITQRVKNGDSLIVDGTDGEVIINPPPVIRKEFSSKKKKYDDYREELKKTAKLSSLTLDKVDLPSY